MKLILLHVATAITAGLIIACPYAGLEFVGFMLIMLIRCKTISHVAHETRRQMIGAAIKIGKRAVNQHVPTD